MVNFFKILISPIVLEKPLNPSLKRFGLSLSKKLKKILSTMTNGDVQLTIKPINWKDIVTYRKLSVFIEFKSLYTYCVRLYFIWLLIKIGFANKIYHTN